MTAGMIALPTSLNQTILLPHSRRSPSAKKHELELGKYRDNLQALVDEQTFKLKEAQFELLQHERLATLGQLTATVSHELRNPLGRLSRHSFRSQTASIEHDSLRANPTHRIGRAQHQPMR